LKEFHLIDLLLFSLDPMSTELLEVWVNFFMIKGKKTPHGSTKELAQA